MTSKSLQCPTFFGRKAWLELYSGLPDSSRWNSSGAASRRFSPESTSDCFNCAPPRRAGFAVEAGQQSRDLEWQDSCMLPGFRILFALVVLSLAILIFGFG